MEMRTLLPFLFLGGISFHAVASPSDALQPAIAVFGVHDRDAVLEQNSLVKVTEQIGKAVSEGNVYRVVSPTAIRRFLSTVGKSESECSDKECQVEVARKLRADKLLSTSIKREGNECIVTSNLLDLKSSSTEFTAAEQGPCDEQGLGESIKKVTAKVLLWAGMQKIEKETRPAPGHNRTDSEYDGVVATQDSSGSSKEDVELNAKPKSTTDKTAPVEIRKAPDSIYGPVSDILFTVGMITNNREGLEPRHKSDTEFGLRIDGMVFLGLLFKSPVLKDIGISGYFSKVFGVQYGINDNNEWDTSQHQWQVGIVYRLALLNDVFLQPTFLLRVGYGQTICGIDADHSVALSASYGYPYVALDVNLMLLKPFLRFYTSGEYLFAVIPGSDLDSDLGSGYSVRVGIDAVFFKHVDVGIGYEISEFFAKIAGTDTTDLYRGFFIRVGYIHY